MHAVAVRRCHSSIRDRTVRLLRLLCVRELRSNLSASFTHAMITIGRFKNLFKSLQISRVIFAQVKSSEVSSHFVASQVKSQVICPQVKSSHKSFTLESSQVASQKNWRLESDSSPSHRLESTTLANPMSTKSQC